MSCVTRWNCGHVAVFSSIAFGTRSFPFNEDMLKYACLRNSMLYLWKNNFENMVYYFSHSVFLRTHKRFFFLVVLLSVCAQWMGSPPCLGCWSPHSQTGDLPGVPFEYCLWLPFSFLSSVSLLLISRLLLENNPAASCKSVAV